MYWKGWTCVAGLAAVAACSFETSSAAGGDLGEGTGGMETETSGNSDDGVDTTTGASTSGTSRGSDPTSDPTTNPTNDPTDPGDSTDTGDVTDTDDTTDTDDSTRTDDSSSTGDPPDGPNVQITGDGFDTIAFGGAGTRDFTLTNDGDVVANDVKLEVTGDFALDDNACSDVLNPGESCTVTISRSGDVLGPFTGALEVSYEGGTADEPLAVEVVGDTGNLLSDGGFESCNGDDWITTGDGTWACGSVWKDISAHTGNGYLAGTISGSQTFTYRLNVDVTAYEHAISTGEMTFDFTGWASTFEEGNDNYRFRVRYRSGSSNLLEFNSGWHSGETWTGYTDTQTLPAGIDTVRIDLQCNKDFDELCDAYFDDIALVGTYDPS